MIVIGTVEVGARYAAAFRDGLAKAEELTPAPRPQAIEGLRPERRSGAAALAAGLDAGRACPHGHHPVCRPWGPAHGLPRLRGAAGGKTFTARTGPPLARRRHRERGGDDAQALLDGETDFLASHPGAGPSWTPMRCGAPLAPPSTGAVPRPPTSPTPRSTSAPASA